jgi:hypothetical protein
MNEECKISPHQIRVALDSFAAKLHTLHYRHSNRSRCRNEERRSHRIAVEQVESGDSQRTLRPLVVAFASRHPAQRAHIAQAAALSLQGNEEPMSSRGSALCVSYRNMLILLLKRGCRSDIVGAREGRVAEGLTLTLSVHVGLLNDVESRRDESKRRIALIAVKAAVEPAQMQVARQDNH